MKIKNIAIMILLAFFFQSCGKSSSAQNGQGVLSPQGNNGPHCQLGELSSNSFQELMKAGFLALDCQLSEEELLKQIP